MTGLRLYSRPDCHLCEVAASLVESQGYGASVESVNIEDDLNLLNRYGLRIPVLQRIDSSAELFWPFDENELASFLGS